MSQKQSVNDFKYVRDFSKLNKGFMKSYNDESVRKYFLEVDV